MKKYYYENKLASQNMTAKPNIVWVADITTLKVKDKKLFIFLCVDAHTNKIIASTVGKNNPSATTIVKSLRKAIDKRFIVQPRTPTILHTDRGTQFSSETYYQFIEDSKEFLIPSMSRPSTPTDNAVAERFMRTFKEHLVDGITLEGALQMSGFFNKPRRIINKYIQSLNNTPNRKTLLKSPERHDNDVYMASMLMVEPKHTKAFSTRIGYDPRLKEIEKFRDANRNVISILEELAAKKAEVVDKTPFDNFEDNLAIKLIDQRLQDLYALVQSNPEQVREYVEDAIEPIIDGIEELNRKVDQLLPKTKTNRDIQPLRDPLDLNLFPMFLANAGNSFKKQTDLKRAQLRVTYTILYYAGFRLNEIRHLTKDDIDKAIQASQFSIIHHKTKQPYIHVLSNKALQDLKNLQLEYDIIFNKYNYKYLFGKDKPIIEKSLIRMVNRDLKHTCQIGNIPYNIKSHSFRINVISSLLKITSVQNTADIIGHKDIRSTLSYKRYALSKSEIKDLLEQINDQS